MFGLDDNIAAFSDGTTVLVVIAVAIVLGLRHAGDPDHVAAVTALIASGKERATRRAAKLGFVWGLGHATTLFIFGLPVVLYSAYLPAPVQSGAETTVGFVIVALALLLLVRWRRGLYVDVPHDHGGATHKHVHARAHVHARTRSAWQAYAIGLVHGMGGTAGFGLLLLATIESHPLAIAALGLFAFFTAVSMALLSTAWGAALGSAPVRRSFNRIAPAVGAVSLAFGAWYALGAQGVVPHVF